jgi:hypothetical protein
MPVPRPNECRESDAKRGFLVSLHDISIHDDSPETNRREASFPTESGGKLPRST